MAINFLNSIDLNQLELVHATIENQATDVLAGTGVAGQVYYNTTDELIKVWDGTLNQWRAVGKYDDLSIATASTSGNVAQVDLKEGSSIIGSAIFSSAAPSSGIDILGSASGISISHHDTSDVLDSDNSGGFVLQDITFDGFGHVLTIGTTNLDNRYVSTITGGDGIKVTDGDTNSATVSVRYTESGSGAFDNIIQKAPTSGTLSAGSEILVNKAGTGTSNAARVALNAIPIDFFATATGDIDLGGNKILDVADPTNAQDAATKAYVDSSVVGNLVYQGGFDGSTGYVAGTTNYLDSRGTQIAVDRGWTYTVTVAGTFYGENVEVGDVLIAEDDLASGTGALTDWTTVQNNIDLASDSQVGIGNVNANTADNREGISVSYSNGTASVGLDIAGLTTESTFDQANTFVPVYTSTGSARNRKIAITDLATEISESNGAKGTIAAASTSGTITHNLGTYDVIVQLFDDVTKETVYADVDRSTTNTVVITFGSAITNAVRVLVQKIA